MLLRAQVKWSSQSRDTKSSMVSLGRPCSDVVTSDVLTPLLETRDAVSTLSEGGCGLLNPFDVLNSVDNDVEFGTNGGTTNLVNSGATSSVSSFMNVDNSNSGTTPIVEKIEKFKDLLTSGQAILMDKDGNPLKKVESLGEYDSEDEVASADNDMARSMAYERGFFT
nr:hypothetical protein [Tanacetum cinerariifolium]